MHIYLIINSVYFRGSKVNSSIYKTTAREYVACSCFVSKKSSTNGQMPAHYPMSALMTVLFALSTAEDSSAARYIRVVFSLSCPIPSLITESGTFFCLAILAHEWRTTYVVSGWDIPAPTPTSFRNTLVAHMAPRYCCRASHPSFVIIGNR